MVRHNIDSVRRMVTTSVFDFSTFYNAIEADRAKLAATITAELQKHGVMRLINTSITAETIEEGFKWVRFKCASFSRVTTTDGPWSMQGKKFFSLLLPEKAV